MFGSTSAVQLQRLHAEKWAYYGLIKPCEIESIAYMHMQGIWIEHNPGVNNLVVHYQYVIKY